MSRVINLFVSPESTLDEELKMRVPDLLLEAGSKGFLTPFVELIKRPKPEVSGTALLEAVR